MYATIMRTKWPTTFFTLLKCPNLASPRNGLSLVTNYLWGKREACSVPGLVKSQFLNSISLFSYCNNSGLVALVGRGIAAPLQGKAHRLNMRGQ